MVEIWLGKILASHDKFLASRANCLDQLICLMQRPQEACGSLAMPTLEGPRECALFCIAG